MNILETLVQLRDDLKTWVTNNLNALNNKIDEKTIPIDSKLSATSTNPVQNKVINAEISSLSDLVGDKSVATQISTAIANQDLFSGDYNDLTNAPNIKDDGSNDLNITDNDGNIIVKVNSTGIHTTEIEVNDIKVGETLSGHINNNDIHVTSDDKDTWNAKSDFSGDYNDLENAPNIAEDGTSDLTIADEVGNIIFKVDAAGAHTTTLDAQNITINNENIDNVMDKKITALVNSAPETLDTLGELAEAMEENSDAIEALEVIATSKASQSDLDATNENISELQGLVGDTSVATQIANAIEGFESFSGDYNDLENAPNIAEDGAGNMVVADEQGNVIFKADAAGIHSTALTLNGEDINNKINNHTDNTTIHVTSTDKTNWNNKVDKEDGKGLSSNDFTDEEKAKLASLPDDINDINIAVDDKLSTTSENPVQNKVVTEAINNLNYNDLDGTPNITDDESKELFIADSSGNVIARINETGIHSVGMSIKGTDVAGLIDSKIDAAVHDIPTAVFSNVKVGSTTITADSINDTLTLVAGSNITLTPDATNDKVTIAAKDTTYTAATTSVTGLMSSADKTKVNATNIAYGTCSTAAATAAKVITVSGNTNWKLAAGSMITVLFSTTNTAKNPTFNVNNTGAKNVYYTSSQITTSNLSYAGYANRPMTFMYDGTQYRFIGWGVDNNSDTKVTQAAAITTAGEYPVILGYSTATTAVTNTVNKASTLTYNPSTKVLTAPTFKGALAGNANTATKATKDGSGNVITSTYATKTYVAEQIQAAIGDAIAASY